MKKKRLIFLGTIILLLTTVLIGFTLTKNKSYATDVSNNFTVIDAHLCSDANCTIEYDENNGIEAYTPFLIKLNWKYESDTPIKNGDEISIPFANEVETETISSWSGIVKKIDMKDNNGQKIGEWSVTGDSGINHKLNIKFSDYAVGKTDIEGTVITSKNIRSSISFKNIIVPITIGNITKNVMLLKNTFEESITSFVLKSDSNTNKDIKFRFSTPSTTVVQLYRSSGLNELSDDVIFNNIKCTIDIPRNMTLSNLKIHGPGVQPTDLENHYASGILIGVPITDKFTIITQNESENLSEFKSRIEKYQYGIFKDNNGNETIIVNFGNQPNDDYTYKDILGMELGDYVHNLYAFSYNSEMRDLLNNLLGEENAVGGKIIKYHITPTFSLDTSVDVETPVTVNGSCTYDTVDGQTKTIYRTGIGTLLPASSIATVKNSAKMLLLDKINKEPLKNVSITLQKQNETSWEDVETQNTSDTGWVTYNNLESGNYRYVQNNYLEHYIEDSYLLYSDSNFDMEIQSFAISDTDTSGNISYASNDREKFTIRYLPGEHGNWTNTERVYNDIYWGDFTPMFDEIESKDEEYVFLGWDKEIANKVYEDATYTAMWKKKVKVTVHHYIEGTNTQIREDEIINTYEGTRYETNSLTNIPDGYELVSEPDNKRGIVGNKDIEVTYYYKLKEYTYTINYVDKETKELIGSETGLGHKGEVITGNEKKKEIATYEYDSMDKESITISETPQEINIYYVRKKNVVVVRYIDIETDKDITEYIETTDKIGIPYTTDKKEFEGYTYVKDSGNTSGVYSSDAIEVIYYYKKKTYKVNTEVVNGEIDPDKEIEHGETVTIKYTGKEGYKLKSVIIDGNSVDISKYPNEYEFKEIKENHRIKVEYEKEEVVKPVEITPTLDDIFTYVFMFGGSILFIILIAIGIKKNKKER